MNKLESKIADIDIQFSEVNNNLHKISDELSELENIADDTVFAATIDLALGCAINVVQSAVEKTQENFSLLVIDLKGRSTSDDE